MSADKLRKAWSASRDASSKPGASGLDKISAISFKSKLDQNIKIIVNRCHNGTYKFDSLRPFEIEKSDGKKRLVCVPCIRDRLLQRLIVAYIDSRRILPIYNDISFGYVRGRGLGRALQAACSLRERFSYVIRTDIEAFFDRIPRQYLKEKVASLLPGCSLNSLIFQIVDADISKKDSHRLSRTGVKAGIGLRQGMPMSPILANIALSSFDKSMSRKKVSAIRYADDILIFGNTEQEVRDKFEVTRDLLAKLDLKIAPIGTSKKSQIYGPSQDVEFLGRSIVKISDKFVTKLSNQRITAITDNLKCKYALHNMIEDKKNILQSIEVIQSTVRAYRGTYRDISNFQHFESKLIENGNKIVSGYLEEIFQKKLKDLTAWQRSFLGLEPW